MRKISLISFIVSILCFILSSSVFAISAGPSGTKATIKPGESYQGIVYTTNTGTEPVVTSIEQTDLIKDGSGDTEYSSTQLPCSEPSLGRDHTLFSTKDENNH